MSLRFFLYLSATLWSSLPARSVCCDLVLTVFTLRCSTRNQGNYNSNPGWVSLQIMTIDLCLYYVFSGTLFTSVLPSRTLCCSSTLPSSDGSTHWCSTKGARGGCFAARRWLFSCATCNDGVVSACVSLHRRAYRCESDLPVSCCAVQQLNCSQRSERSWVLIRLCVTSRWPSQGWLALSASPPPSLRGGLHYPGQSSVEPSGGPRPFECRNAPAICCTLELDLQPNSISSPN